MRALEDTHALLWWLSDESRANTSSSKGHCRDQKYKIVSAASAWSTAHSAWRRFLNLLKGEN